MSRRYRIPDRIMAARCKTCLFNNDADVQVQNNVQERVLTSGSLMCHSTGWPQGTHLCRGARDFQLMILHRLGFLAEPTDEAWANKLAEVRS